jgi:hypothetical protein
LICEEREEGIVAIELFCVIIKPHGSTAAALTHLLVNENEKKIECKNSDDKKNKIKIILS